MNIWGGPWKLIIWGVGWVGVNQNRGTIVYPLGEGVRWWTVCWGERKEHRALYSIALEVTRTVKRRFGNIKKKKCSSFRGVGILRKERMNKKKNGCVSNVSGVTNGTTYDSAKKKKNSKRKATTSHIALSKPTNGKVNQGLTPLHKSWKSAVCKGRF